MTNKTNKTNKADKADKTIFLPGTQVMFEVPQLLSPKCTTFFRGFKEHHYIILDFPYDPSGVPLPLKDQMSCVVRFLFQGKVYGFESQIQQTSKYPYPFVFINYPKELNYINLRSSERYPIRIPAVYSKEALAILGSLEGHPAGVMLDLSEKGCLLETNQSIELETPLFLAFNLPNQELIQNLAAKVKRISRKDEAYQLGLMFMVSEDPDIEKIRNYLSFLSGLQIQG